MKISLFTKPREQLVNDKNARIYALVLLRKALIGFGRGSMANDGCMLEDSVKRARLANFFGNTFELMRRNFRENEASVKSPQDKEHLLDLIKRLDNLNAEIVFPRKMEIHKPHHALAVNDCPVKWIDFGRYTNSSTVNVPVYMTSKKESIVKYYEFFLSKKTPGKYRLITAPMKDLKGMLRKANSMISEHIENESILAYKPGGDYVKKLNEESLKYQFMTTLDIKDYYSNIYGSTLKEAVEHFLNRRYYTAIKNAETSSFGNYLLDRTYSLIKALLTDEIIDENQDWIFDLLTRLIYLCFTDVHVRQQEKLLSILNKMEFFRELDLKMLFEYNSKLLVEGGYAEAFIVDSLLYKKIENLFTSRIPVGCGDLFTNDPISPEVFVSLLGKRSDTLKPSELKECTTLTDYIRKTKLTPMPGALMSLKMKQGATLKFKKGLPQGSPVSGALSNYVSEALYQKMVKVLDELPYIDKYKLLIYSDNVYCLFDIKEKYSGSPEECGRIIYSELSKVCVSKNLPVNKDKEGFFENDKKILGLLLDINGNTRVSRRTLRTINQIIINLNKQPVVNYKGKTFNRDDIRALKGLINWLNRPTNEGYSRKIIKPNFM